MTASGTSEVRRLNRWPNRPGRDLLVSIAILYLGYSVFAFSRTGDFGSSLPAPFLFALTLPVGLLYSYLIPGWLTVLAAAAPVVAFAALVIRLPWFVRIPALLVATAGAAYVTLQMGVAIN